MKNNQIDTVKFNLLQSVKISFADLQVLREKENLTEDKIGEIESKLKNYLEIWYKEEVLGK